MMTPGQAGILRSQSVHHSAARQEQIRAQFFLSPPEGLQAEHAARSFELLKHQRRGRRTSLGEKRQQILGLPS
jgi:hypothetical protein